MYSFNGVWRCTQEYVINTSLLLLLLWKETEQAPRKHTDIGRLTAHLHVQLERKPACIKFESTEVRGCLAIAARWGAIHFGHIGAFKKKDITDKTLNLNLKHMERK